jgi:hypothetical protein
MLKTQDNFYLDNLSKICEYVSSEKKQSTTLTKQATLLSQYYGLTKEEFKNKPKDKSFIPKTILVCCRACSDGLGDWVFCVKLRNELKKKGHQVFLMFQYIEEEESIAKKEIVQQNLASGLITKEECGDCVNFVRNKLNEYGKNLFCVFFDVADIADQVDEIRNILGSQLLILKEGGFSSESYEKLYKKEDNTLTNVKPVLEDKSIIIKYTTRYVPCCDHIHLSTGFLNFGLLVNSEILTLRKSESKNLDRIVCYWSNMTVFSIQYLLKSLCLIFKKKDIPNKDDKPVNLHFANKTYDAFIDAICSFDFLMAMSEDCFYEKPFDKKSLKESNILNLIRPTQKRQSSYKFRIMGVYMIVDMVLEKVTCTYAERTFIVTKMKKMNNTEFLIYLHHSSDICACTGDQSLFEAVLLNKFPIYDCKDHKLKNIQQYLTLIGGCEKYYYKNCNEFEHTVITTDIIDYVEKENERSQNLPRIKRQSSKNNTDLINAFKYDTDFEEYMVSPKIVFDAYQSFLKRGEDFSEYLINYANLTDNIERYMYEDMNFLKKHLSGEEESKSCKDTTKF